MSARFPSFDTRIVTCHGQPESFVCVALERGIRMKLHNPEVNSWTTQFEVSANRQEITKCREIDRERVTQYHARDYATPATPRAGRETPFRRDGETYQHATRIYCDPAPITSVLVAHGLSGSVVRLRPHHCYQMIRCVCIRHQWRTAQLAWLVKMISPNERGNIMTPRGEKAPAINSAAPATQGAPLHVVSDKRAPVEELSLFV